MTYIEYLAYISDAKKSSSPEEFTLEMGYGFMTPYSAENWQRVCNILFAVAHGDCKAVVGNASARAFAIKYNIPDRTVQRWCTGERGVPEYVLQLLGFAVIAEIPTEERHGDNDKEL